MRRNIVILTFTAALIITGVMQTIANSPGKAIAATSQPGMQTISPSTCDYSTPTDYFCSLPPGSTIRLPMSAPARTPDPGWFCVPGTPSTHIAYYGGPTPDSGLSITWVGTGGGSCGAVSGYAEVAVSPRARPQYLAADFFLSNVFGECKISNPGLCANGMADNGTRWSLNITLPQYVVKFSHQVVTSNFPNGTTPYVFPDYPPPGGPSPPTNAATVTCSVTTKMIPAQNQISYSGDVSCNSPNGIVGRIAFNIYRIWQDRTDFNGGGVFLCSQQSYQSSCQTPTYTFQTYGNNPAVYKVAIDVNLLNPTNGEGLPGNVIQYTGADYQLVPYNNANTPYPLVNPSGWNNHHLQFPDFETLPSFTYCPVGYQGSLLHPQCTAYNTPLLRSNTISSYGQRGYIVPSGVTPSSSGPYITQYVDPIECGGTTNGSNGVFLKPSEATQFTTWWNNFSPCAPQPPTLALSAPSQNFTTDIGDKLQITASSNAGAANPSVSFFASYPGYSDPANPNNHWFALTTLNAPTKGGNTYQYAWDLKAPNGQPVPTGALSIMATACTAPNDCVSKTVNGNVRRRLFLFALGLSSSYNTANPDPAGFGDMQNRLLQAYPGSDSKFFIYPDCGQLSCSNTSYSTDDTCTNNLPQDISALEQQVRSYAATQPNTDIYIIGDSLGGTTGFGYLAQRNLENWAALPNSGQLKGVVAIDAPLGGIPAADVPGIDAIFHTKCIGISQLSMPIIPLIGLGRIANASAGYFGGSASIENLLSSAQHSTNQQVAQAAAGHGTKVLSIGNLQDYGYAMSGCVFIKSFLLSHGLPDPSPVDFIGSQFLSDLQTGGVYGRYIDKGLVGGCDFDTFFNQVNHGIAMSNSEVEQSVVDLVGGQRALPLPIYFNN